MSTTSDHELNSTSPANLDPSHHATATPDSGVDPAGEAPTVGAELSTPQPSALTAAKAAGKAKAQQVLAELNRAKEARQEAWKVRYQAQQDARRRLAERYGSDLEKRWIANPNAPQVDAVSLLYAFLHKAGPANIQSPEMEQAPTLERDDALAAAHLIHAAREHARQREIAVMRQILALGVTWDELAHALETTPEDLKDLLRWWL